MPNCKVAGCHQNHMSHYCKFCRDSNSNHFSRNCTRGQNFQNYKKIGCLVQGCKQNHDKHYCKVCHNKNSNHFASFCPQGINLYHGTTLQCAQSIKKTGFRPSNDGCMGKGVYFTPIWQEAVAIAKRWGKAAAVIECRLDQDSDHVQDRIHTPWMTNNSFQEYVVRQQYIKRIKIVKIHQV